MKGRLRWRGAAQRGGEGEPKQEVRHALLQSGVVQMTATVGGRGGGGKHEQQNTAVAGATDVGRAGGGRDHHV